MMRRCFFERKTNWRKSLLSCKRCNHFRRLYRSENTIYMPGTYRTACYCRGNCFFIADLSCISASVKIQRAVLRNTDGDFRYSYDAS